MTFKVDVCENNEILIRIGLKCSRPSKKGAFIYFLKFIFKFYLLFSGES